MHRVISPVDATGRHKRASASSGVIECANEFHAVLRLSAKLSGAHILTASAAAIVSVGKSVPHLAFLIDSMVYVCVQLSLC